MTNRTCSNVAVKIINMNDSSQEFKVLHHLQHSSVTQANVDHPGRASVLQLLDQLWFKEHRAKETRAPDFK